MLSDKHIFTKYITCNKCIVKGFCKEECDTFEKIINILEMFDVVTVILATITIVLISIATMVFGPSTYTLRIIVGCCIAWVLFIYYKYGRI